MMPDAVTNCHHHRLTIDTSFLFLFAACRHHAFRCRLQRLVMITMPRPFSSRSQLSFFRRLLAPFSLMPIFLLIMARSISL